MRKALVIWFLRGRFKVIQIFAKIIFRRIRSKNNRLIIVRAGELGDNLTTLPLIRALKLQLEPSEIHIWGSVDKKNPVSLYSLAEPNLVHQYYNFSSLSFLAKVKLLRKWRSADFYYVPQNLEAAYRQIYKMFLFRMVGVVYVGGWSARSTRWFGKTVVRYRLNDCLTETKAQLKIASDYFGTQLKAIYAPLTGEQTEANYQIIPKTVGLVIGAKIQSKQWPISYFSSLAKMLIAEGYTVVLIGGENDRTLAEAGQFEEQPSLINLCGKTSIQETYSIVANVNVLVTNDTGPMHLTAISKTPTVAIFSSWSFPATWYPDNPNCTVLRSDIECSPCFETHCAARYCLTHILPSQVYQQIKKLETS